MQYKRRRHAQAFDSRPDQRFAVASAMIQDIACKPLPYVFARMGLPPQMGISRSLWGEACVAMGRECAAVAVALVSAKPAEHFRTSPGGYFHGMVSKAKAGELNLVRTIWGLRQAKAAKARGPGH